MESGLEWSIATFGDDGASIRDRVPVLVREEQVASADAQEASGHRSRSVFGQYSRGLLERFEEFGRLPGAAMVRPGQAPYRVPAVNGVVLFPWRYGDGYAPSAVGVRFATSDAREALFGMGPIPVQGQLDLEVPVDASDTDPLTHLLRGLVEGTLTSKVVVVAVACSPSGVQDITWGEVQLDVDGGLNFLWSESLLDAKGPGLSLVRQSDRSFVDGELPRLALALQSETDDLVVGDSRDDA